MPADLPVSLGFTKGGTHTEASKSITVAASAEARIKRVAANGMRLSAAVNVPIDPGHTGMSGLVRFDAQ